jgi:DNA-directed RNA polymerase specialized sigma subunit
MNKNKFCPDRRFQELSEQINNTLIENDKLIGDQKAQVELVLKLERKFKSVICKNTQGLDIYKKFVNFIIVENGNILSARPYFREKSKTFNEFIASALRESNTETLMKYDINYKLIEFILKNWEGDLPEKAKEYYKKFIKARQVLIENNLPLAINRAVLFFNKTPKSRLTLLDLIDICTIGLVDGVDKYVGKYTRVWRSVCIGRMVGDMIHEYSETFLRMYPIDRKILYRANSLKYKLKIEDIGELTKEINESFERDKLEGKAIPKLPISESYVVSLINGSSYVSADSKINISDDFGEEGVDNYDNTPESEESVEDQVIKKDLLTKISGIIHTYLNIIEKKIIKLKGVDL